MVKAGRGFKKGATNGRSGETEEEEDELGDGGASDAERQLLMEAALSETPTKRKPGRPRKNPLPENITEAELASDVASPRLKKATPNDNSRKTPTSLGRKLGLQHRPRVTDGAGDHETEDELQRAGTDEKALPFEPREVVSGTMNAVEFALKSPKSNISLQKPSRLSEAELRQFDIIKTIVLGKLSQKRTIPLTGLKEEYGKVYQLVEATVTAGESNSMLLIGARGSGKTALVNKVIDELSKNQKDNFYAVRLNGFIHTDDKLALREIWRQLGREMEVEEDEGKGLAKSYADTLAVLLSILSHPNESQTSNDGDAVAKSVVFVMDEFDLFASHPRQTLLYNLLDIAQSRKAPIAVLGLTTRIDVSEGLEKRVKSRFSHRYVHIGLPRTLSAFMDIVKSAIGLETDELRFDERTSLLSGIHEAHTSAKKRKGRTVVASETDPLVLWNASVAVSTRNAIHPLQLTLYNQALITDSSFLRTQIQPIYSTTKSIPSLLTSLIPAISHLHHPTFPATALRPTLTLLPPPSTLALLPSLSECALALLIAAARLTLLHATDALTFGLAHAEYAALAAAARVSAFAAGAAAVAAPGTRVWSTDVCRAEWERLLRVGLLVPALGAGEAAAAGAAKVMVRVDVALEEIPLAVEGLGAVMRRWCMQL